MRWFSLPWLLSGATLTYLLLVPMLHPLQTSLRLNLPGMLPALPHAHHPPPRHWFQLPTSFPPPQVPLGPAQPARLVSPSSSSSSRTACDTCDTILHLMQHKLGVTKVVIWGYQMTAQPHTTAFVFFGFWRAFAHIGLPVYWLSDQDAASIDPSFLEHALVFTMANDPPIDTKLPVVDTARYIVHTENSMSHRYDRHLSRGTAIEFRVFGTGPNSVPFDKYFAPHGDIMFSYACPKRRVILLPWATDLLPHEVRRNKAMVRAKYASNQQRDRSGGVVFVGSVWEPNAANFAELAAAVRRAGLVLAQFGNYFVWDTTAAQFDHGVLHFAGVSMEENVRLVQQAYLAPSVQGSQHLKHVDEQGVTKAYIPCRIFKNLSYGALGVTNNEAVFEFFGGGAGVVYDRNISALMEKADAAVQGKPPRVLEEAQLKLMEVIAEKHTYVQRIGTLVEFLAAMGDHDAPSWLYDEQNFE